MIKVSLSLDAIWRNFIKWAGLLHRENGKKTRQKFEITPFSLKTYSTGVPQWIIHLLKVSLSLVAIWGNFIKWAGLLLSKKKKKKWGNSETTPFSLKTYSTGVAQSIEHLMKVSLSLDAIWRIFIKWAGLLLRRKRKKNEKILKWLRLPRKLTQKEYCSRLNTCWKFHWVWMRSEKFLLNELDFYLEERGHGWETVSSPPFDLKTNSTTVRH